MSEADTFIQVFAGSPAASPASIAGMLAGLAIAALHLFAVAPRWQPHVAAIASALLAALMLGASWLLLRTASVWWPAWPAALALLFGQLGVLAGHARRQPSAASSSAAPAGRSAARAAPQAEPHRSAARAAHRADRTRSAAEAPAARSASTGAGRSPDPKRLGRYRIDRQLGGGAMGAVYLGHDVKIGRQVAIKTMALSREFHGAELTEARARFLREAKTAGRLQHRDIVTIYDAGEERGLAYIAMEYVKGHDLQRHTHPSSLLPVPVVLHIVARVADALAYAHSQGVVHRDIKPANVMVDAASDSVKVTDFGVARVTDSSRTQTGMVLGTPSFMSPEQMAGRRVDGRSDLYSLGVMLFQLLTGRLPHQADSMAGLLHCITNDPAPDLRTLRPELPAALADVVALALEKRAEVRYSDGRRFADDLRAIAASCELLAAPAFADTLPEADEFEATAKLSRDDPRHNRLP